MSNSNWVEVTMRVVVRPIDPDVNANDYKAEIAADLEDELPGMIVEASLRTFEVQLAEIDKVEELQLPDKDDGE